MAVRTSIRGAVQSPEQIARYRNALARMKTIGDDRGFEWFASVHGLPFTIWCEHGTLLFLPWHRAFLYYFELALQTRLGPRFSLVEPAVPGFADLGLLWWDWASDESHQEGIPPDFANEQIDGQPNPLAGSQIASCPGGDQVTVGVWSAALLSLIRNHHNPNIRVAISPTDPPRTRRASGPPDDLPRQSTLDNFILPEASFASFSGALEQVHDDVHGWVGGSMSVVPTSAYDPIFWSHHTMIDRLWYVWQIGPRGQNPSPNLMNTVLTPFPRTVADTLSIQRLGYEYAVQIGV